MNADNTNCTLVNFGDNMRVLHDINQRFVKMMPGTVKRANLDPVAIKFIEKGMQSTPADPLCVFTDEIELPADMRECLAIMAEVTTQDYDEVLQRTAALIGYEALGKTKPTRGEILGLLKGVVEKFQKVTIKEQVPNKFDERRTPSEQRPEAPDRSKPDAPAPKNIAPGAVQSSYQPTMAQVDDTSDGVLADIVEPAKVAKAETKPRSEKKPVSKTKKRERVKIE